MAFDTLMIQDKDICSMKRMILILVLSAMVLNISGQVDKVKDTEQKKGKKPFKERLVTGGDVILSFGTNGTQIGLSPLLGYRVTDKYTAGIGATYIYGSFPGFTSQILGGRVFNRLMVFDQFFLQGEFEYNDFNQKIKLFRDKINYSFPAILAGAGYRSSIGGRSSVSFMVLYDILQDPKSFYQGPIIRGGVNIGF